MELLQPIRHVKSPAYCMHIEGHPAVLAIHQREMPAPDIGSRQNKTADYDQDPKQAVRHPVVPIYRN